MGISMGNYTTSWIGNSFSGADHKWVQNNIHGMYVTADGTCYTNSSYDESGREAGIYKDGDVVGLAQDLHGWSRLGGSTLTVNSQYLYIAMVQGYSGQGLGDGEDYPPEGTTWYCVRRYTLSGECSTIPGGRGWDSSMLIVSTDNEVTGLAIGGSELYVAVCGENIIRVYSTESMQELRNFSVTHPRGITVDSQGNLWIIQQKGSTNGKVLQYSNTGIEIAQISDVVVPSAIAISHGNANKLLVAENGQKQQIFIYDISSNPQKITTFGVENGIFSENPGEIAPLKFYGIIGVGTDSSGSIYVACNGFSNSGCDLRKFSSSGDLQWQLLGLHFIDNADVDPDSDGVDVFTKQEHFVMDYNKAAGQEWTYKDYTINPFKYPQDARLHTMPAAVFFRRIRGKPFLFMIDMYDSFLEIYRFNPDSDGLIAIPSGMFTSTNEDSSKPALAEGFPPNQPNTGEWIWRDRDGNGAFDPSEFETSTDHPYVGGWWVDSNGDVWKTVRSTTDGIRYFPLQGLDSQGNLIYNYSSRQILPHPSFFTDLRRIEYYPSTDTMYLTGFTTDNPAPYDDAGVVGSELARFDGWSTGNCDPSWRTVLPVDNRPNEQQILYPVSISVAGDYIFVVTIKTKECYIYRSTGEQVQILTPGTEVVGDASTCGWVDIRYGVRAYRRLTGEYLVFVEEDNRGKVLMYRWMP